MRFEPTIFLLGRYCNRCAEYAAPSSNNSEGLCSKNATLKVLKTVPIIVEMFFSCSEAFSKTPRFPNCIKNTRSDKKHVFSG